MAYAPTQKVIDTRFIGRNILAYVEATQEEALPWANDGEDLKTFQQFADSLANRLKPVMPSIAIADDSQATIFDGDVLQPVYRIVFEVMIGGANPNGLFTQAKRYAYALESLLLNIPSATVTADSENLISVKPSTFETDFDAIGVNDSKNYFMQMFQTKATYLLTASAY